MPCPRRRHCKSRRDKNRTHKKLHSRLLTSCEKCGAMRRAHYACPTCGTYKGREYRTVVTS